MILFVFHLLQRGKRMETVWAGKTNTTIGANQVLRRLRFKWRSNGTVVAAESWPRGWQSCNMGKYRFTSTNFRFRHTHTCTHTFRLLYDTRKCRRFFKPTTLNRYRPKKSKLTNQNYSILLPRLQHFSSWKCFRCNEMAQISTRPYTLGESADYFPAKSVFWQNELKKTQ